MTDTTADRSLEITRPRVRITPIEKDSHTSRNWIIRWIETVLWAVLLVGGGAILFGQLLTWPLRIVFPSTESWAPFAFGWIGAFIGAYYFGVLFATRLTKIVPRNQALVTTNLLSSQLSDEEGAMVPYGPGLHLSSAFEDVNEEGNISTKIITFPFVEQIPTKSSEITATGFVLLRASLRRLERFAQVSEETLSEGVVGVIKGHLQARLSNEKAEDALPDIEQLSKEVTEVFGVTTSTGERRGFHEDEPTDFEQEFGADIIAAAISGLDLPKSVQQARDANAQLEQVKTQIAIIAGVQDHGELIRRLDDGKITPDQYRRYLQLALIASKSAEGKINIHEVAGSNPQNLGAGAVLGASIQPDEEGRP